jgi:hypothetical protein
MPQTYTPIATQNLGTAAASVTFSSIPSTYTDLIMIVSGKASSVSQSLRAIFNGDTASNYSTTLLSGTGTTATSSRETDRSDGILFGVATLSNNSSCIYHIFNYSNTIVYKTVTGRRSSGPNANVAADVGLWRNTAAINTIAITLDGSQNIAAGSTFTLYGIKAA